MQNPLAQMMQSFTPQEVNTIMERFPLQSEEWQRGLLRDLDAHAALMDRQKRQEHYLEFVKYVDPTFIMGHHIRIMADAFERIANGTLKRLMIHMPPGHSKSHNASFLFPAWYLGKFPDRRIIQTSHTADLSVEFGRKLRDKVTEPEYKDVFPGLHLRADKKASGHWVTNRGGEYFAIGVGGKIAGRRAHLFIIDDPHSEQEAVMAVANPEIYDNTFKWYQTGPVQRLFPDAAIMIICTKWSKRDLPGQLMQEEIRNHRGKQRWEVIEFPAWFEDDQGNPKAALWPEFWSLDKLIEKKAEMSPQFWNAAYMQSPTSEEGAIVKRDWWKIWDPESPDAKALGMRIHVDRDGNPIAPKCEFIIQSWDTAHTTKTRSDPSACITLGVFSPKPETEPDLKHVILLNAFQAKLEFHELKESVKENWKEWQPDSVVIEAKSSGLDLISEMRRMGVPVEDFSVPRGTKLSPNDKISRVNAISDIFRSGMVWAPQYRWAEEVANQLAEFPNSDHDDLVDALTAAITRYRRGGFIRLPSDEKEEKRQAVAAPRGYF